MKKCIRIRNLSIGEGLSKIIVPVCAKTEKELLSQAASLFHMPVDAVEWRADQFGAIFEERAVLHTLQSLREAAGDLPLLFTIRTKSEGGSFEGTKEAYFQLNLAAAKSGLADLVDVEFGEGSASIMAHVQQLQASGVRVVASSHNFDRTPSQAEMVLRLQAMQRSGADIVKIAVMPNSAEDVLRLLCASEEFNRLYTDRPVIAISMGGLGCVSRVAGAVSGSDMTFGAVDTISAPGQLPANTLDGILRALHTSC